MSVATTNYKIKLNGTGELTDICGIFQPYVWEAFAPATGFKVNGVDLSTLFSPLSSGTSIGYNTGMTMKVGTVQTDLQNIFEKYDPFPFRATGSYTYTKDANNYYTVVFASYSGTPTTNTPTILNTSSTGKIIFTKQISQLQIVLVGGGGKGGDKEALDITFGTGGGSGGKVVNNTVNNISANTSYTITVGNGATSILAGGTTTVGTSYSAVGGNNGSYRTITPGKSVYGTNSTVGKGGYGGDPYNIGGSFGMSGHDGVSVSLLNSISYTFAGGGGGGYYNSTLVNYPGGLGGGGGHKNNNNVDYTGPNGIGYVTSNYNTGLSSSGGGGSGAYYKTSFQTGGGGGSGIVIFCFQYSY